MPIEFHGPDDEHAPFPHRVVVKVESYVRTRKGVIHFPRQEFIICASCDHWIVRPAGKCACEYKCHQLAEFITESAEPTKSGSVRSISAGLPTLGKRA